MNSRKDYFREESPKSEILYAALEEFVRFGKKGARMQSIADKAGVNKALLHYYFSSKENLHKEVLRRMLENAFSRISTSLEEALEPRDQIRQIIGKYYDFICTFPELPRLMLYEINTNPEEIASFFSQVFIGDQHVPQTIIGVIREGIEKQQFCEVDPKQFLITALSTILFFFGGRPLLTRVLEIEDESEFIRQRKQHVLDVLLTYLERE